MIWINDDGNIFKNPLYLNDRLIFNPSDEQLIAAGYHKAEPTPPEPTPTVYRFSKRW